MKEHSVPLNKAEGGERENDGAEQDIMSFLVRLFTLHDLFVQTHHHSLTVCDKKYRYIAYMYFHKNLCITVAYILA